MLLKIVWLYELHRTPMERETCFTGFLKEISVCGIS